MNNPQQGQDPSKRRDVSGSDSERAQSSAGGGSDLTSSHLTPEGAYSGDRSLNEALLNEALKYTAKLRGLLLMINDGKLLSQSAHIVTADIDECNDRYQRSLDAIEEQETVLEQLENKVTFDRNKFKAAITEFNKFIIDILKDNGVHQLGDPINLNSCSIQQSIRLLVCALNHFGIKDSPLSDEIFHWRSSTSSGQANLDAYIRLLNKPFVFHSVYRKETIANVVESLKVELNHLSNLEKNFQNSRMERWKAESRLSDLNHDSKLQGEQLNSLLHQHSNLINTRAIFESLPNVLREFSALLADEVLSPEIGKLIAKINAVALSSDMSTFNSERFEDLLEQIENALLNPAQNPPILNKDQTEEEKNPSKASDRAAGINEMQVNEGGNTQPINLNNDLDVNRAILRMPSRPMLKVHIRWMIRRDMPEVLQIERSSFEFPWSEDDFVRCLRQRNCIGMVAEFEDTIAGFMIYELHKNRLHVLNFAVHEEYRNSKVGTQMVDKLTSKLSHGRRTNILLEVRETNLPAQLFFRNAGFRAVSVLRDFYDDTIEDAYMMEKRFKEGQVDMREGRDRA